MIARRPLLALLAAGTGFGAAPAGALAAIVPGVAPAGIAPPGGTAPGPPPGPPPGPSPRRPLPVVGEPALMQRVILRPGATLHPQPGPAQGHDLPGFTVYYVYATATNATGTWLEIGRAADGDIAGWTPAAKTIAWRHSMIGAFTNPVGRGRALFFAAKAPLKALLEGKDCGPRAAALRAVALSRKPGPVIAVEPAQFVDITKNFYLLPILSAEPIDTYSGASVRLIETISAPAHGPAARAPSQAEALAKFRGGLVFLLDTTESMQPYIDTTRAALGGLIGAIGQTAVAKNFRFGAIGFRDSLRDNPLLHYTTKIFAQPDFARPPQAVLAAMARMRASHISSREFDEDPIAGIDAAIEKINWTGLAGRYVVLVTDAGARGPSDPLSATGLGIPQIRSLAASRGISISVMHLLTPEGARAHDHGRAAAEYRALTRQPDGGSLYFPVPGGTPAALHRTMHNYLVALLQQVGKTIGVPIPLTGPPPPPRMVRRLAIAAEAMRLAYLGQVEGARAPDVIHGYTSDHSYAHPSRRSIDVRVLLTRNQLSDLASALAAILRAGEASLVKPQTFFAELEAAVVAGSTDPRQIPHYARLGDALGQFLKGLPYHSKLMDISQADWLAMGGIAQDEKLREVAAKLRLYRHYADSPTLWVDLAGPDKPGEAVFPVPLHDLP